MNVPLFAGLCLRWERNAHGHRWPSHTDCKKSVSYRLWCRKTTLHLSCKNFRAEEKSFSSVSGLVLGLVSPVLETEEMKPNPHAWFQVPFLVSWKSLSIALKKLVISGHCIWVL